jgi:hypothetical protein
VDTTVADQQTSLTISLRRGDTPAPQCIEVADFLYDYFMSPASPGDRFGRYQEACSIIELTASFDDYYGGLAGYATRRKVRRAEKTGYTFSEIEYDDHLDDIFAVNTSMDERQGRPMDESYRSRPGAMSLTASPCPRHREACFAVLLDEHVVAYTLVYVAGDMCLFNRILGHGDHLEQGVMYQLVAGTIRDLIQTSGLRYAMYERHTSGTPGLQFFKERMGFRPYWVDWQRADEPVESTRRYFVAAGRSPTRLARRAARKARRTVKGLFR